MAICEDGWTVGCDDSFGKIQVACGHTHNSPNLAWRRNDDAADFIPNWRRNGDNPLLHFLPEFPVSKICTRRRWTSLIMIGAKSNWERQVLANIAIGRLRRIDGRGSSADNFTKRERKLPK
ncbi:hypothetical protein EMPG_15867 [Blastomyces silverae]|uniref:Uncharacterized protein n=1 Tax=Blastomyces silverae TaxID=2060906 RepID=A0A0H1BC58_9EURO|nr:hypothetical protein EMPG_15867 [Blastomyces silverae]